MAVLLAAGLVAAGTAAYGAYSSNQAGKKAASALGNYETFNPIEPEDPRTVDWKRIINEAIGLNVSNAQLRNQLARQVNTFQGKEQQRMLRKFQPYYDSLQRQIGQNALSYSRGELPEDVVSSIGRAAASRGLRSGIGMGARGGQAGTALGSLNLRNLGLTSLDLSRFGTNLAMNANIQAKNLSPGLFDPTFLMVSPQQGVAYEAQNVSIQNDAARYWNQLQNQGAMQNTALANRSNQMAIEARLAGQQAQAQQIAAAGQALSGAIGGMGGGVGGMGGTATNTPYVPMNAPTGGAVPGYGYNPSGGYYPLA